MTEKEPLYFITKFEVHQQECRQELEKLKKVIDGKVLKGWETIAGVVQVRDSLKRLTEFAKEIK